MQIAFRIETDDPRGPLQLRRLADVLEQLRDGSPQPTPTPPAERPSLRVVKADEARDALLKSGVFQEPT